MRVGDDLVCRDDLLAEGRAPAWHWDGCAEDDYNHSWVVCLFPTRADAEYLMLDPDFAGFRLLAVDFEDEDEVAQWVIEICEGDIVYPAVAGRIPGEWIRVA